MRSTTFFSLALAGIAAAGAAHASVTEPNQLVVPIDSSLTGNGEEQLYTLFTDQKEGINWLTDAHTTPNQFSPLCGFTATYLLNQAADQLGLAWYNDTGTKPAAADLHMLVPAGSAVGATFSGTAIKNDPAYTGGVVGFALVGGETHYTNFSYDTTCTSCTPPGPWITALIYASTATPNAYYICFEDGPTSSSSWSNDGDFNDDVYFVTGISCSGGGQPCDTGLKGICGPGLTQCTATGTGTTCQELNPPAPSESCNGLDDNCDGQVDEGNPCPEEYVCTQGTCVKSCVGGEFPCGGNLVCNGQGFCVDPACLNVTCPSGQVCGAGICRAPCDGVTCPYPDVCRVDKCVDPCASVTCPSGEVCSQGVCVTSCACQPCAAGNTCNATSGQCAETSCATVTCNAGMHCVNGTCEDDCAGAKCPPGQACSAGACVADADAGVTPPTDGGGFVNPDHDGGAGSSGGGDDASTGSSSGGGADGGLPPLGAKSKAGCACNSVGAGSGGDALLASTVAALVLSSLRRRRKGRAGARQGG